jgi:hypothetical protein
MLRMKPGEGLDLLKSTKSSDLVITCEGHEFSVHKVVVCSQSDFFATCCNSNFLEAHTSKIDIKETRVELLAVVLRYMYTGEVKTNSWAVVWNGVTVEAPKAETWPTQSIEFLIELYGLADRLMMPYLMTAINSKVQRLFPRLDTCSYYSKDAKLLTSILDLHLKLAGLLQLVYQHTISQDTELRVFMTMEACESFTNRVQNGKQLIRVLLANEPVAFRIMMQRRGITNP